MALAPYFERVYGALGGHLAVSRESLDVVLRRTTIGIECVDGNDANSRWIAEISANLVARLYPRIALTGETAVTDALAILVRRINPNIEIADGSAAGETTIRVGGTATPLSGQIGASSSGWVARVGSGLPLSGPANPYAAAAAGALACAELFRRVFLSSASRPDVSVSLLSFGENDGAEDILPALDVGAVWMVGAGAVGNGALWALSRHTALSGHITVIDPEELSLFNLQRYLLGTVDLVGTPKVELARQALMSTRLSISGARSTLEDVAEAAGESTIPAIVVSVDNVDGRRVAQALLPRLVVNGWTGDQAVGASWHQFDRPHACLACLYHPHGPGLSAIDQAARALGLTQERATILWITQQPLLPADITAAAKALGVTEDILGPWLGKPLGALYTDAVCGAVPLDVVGVGRVETVPLAHQSALAGALMAAELVKRTSPALSTLSQPEPLVSYDDILRDPPRLWVKPRARTPGCFCGDADYQAVYRDKWLMGPS